MATIKPFCCVRPSQELVSRIAALPYDVYNREEAKEVVEKEPLSFLRIDRAETNFSDDVSTYDDRVYQKAKELLDHMVEKGEFVKDQEESYYVYELIMEGRSQTGVVACASIDDYLENKIKKHENTREEKEIDRIRHVDTCNAQTGPIFLAYRSVMEINRIVEQVKQTSSIYGFTSEDGITHNVWKVTNALDSETMQQEFAKQDSIYIADGHHRAASAVKVGLKRREENPGYDGTEEFNYFLSVLFPDDQLMIMPYNRAIKDLNGLSEGEFLEKVAECFEVECLGDRAYQPEHKAIFGMYLGGRWYRLAAKDTLTRIKDCVLGLDVSLLQEYLLYPILNIEDPRTDNRIDFIGGIRGLRELERVVDKDMMVAFSLYPTSIGELFAVADAGKLMPPKSTWFEPKLRSGIFIHELS